MAWPAVLLGPRGEPGLTLAGHGPRGQVSTGQAPPAAPRQLPQALALAAYLTIDSIRDLAIHAQPRRSVPGLTVTAAALIVMPALAIAKRRTGKALGNRTLVADFRRDRLLRLHLRRRTPGRMPTRRSSCGGRVTSRSTTS